MTESSPPPLWPYSTSHSVDNPCVYKLESRLHLRKPLRPSIVTGFDLLNLIGPEHEMYCDRLGVRG